MPLWGMSPIQRREAIIEASAEIKRLRSEIAERNEDLLRQENALDRLIAGETITSGQSQELDPQRELALKVVEKFRERTLNQQIIDILDGFPNKTFSAEDVAELIPGAQLASIRSALARLSDAGRIRRADRGQYQSATGPVVEIMHTQVS